MSDRRDFLRTLAGASAGLWLGRGGILAAAPQSQVATAAKRREVKVGGRRVKTIDVHSHITVPEIAAALKGTSLEANIPEFIKPQGVYQVPVGPERLARLDAAGIDVQVLSINAFWYSLDRDSARKLIDVQNEALAAMCAKYPDRFVALASVALQFPELAAQQLEDASKHLGLRGAAIGGSVQGEELSSRKFDPFWAKAEELGALIFVHPQDSAAATGIRARVQGYGRLDNVIGNPLETTLFLSHLILEGTLDRFPNLKICAAHGGGYLPSYSARTDRQCLIGPDRCNNALKKKPSEYLKQLYYDSIVFTPEALRHLVAVCGASQIVLGTDYPFGWEDDPVDPVLATPGLSDADRVAILGGTMSKLLRNPAY